MTIPVAPAWIIEVSVVVPTLGISKRLSCAGLAVLATTTPPLPRNPPRKIQASVPSMASSAMTARFFTTTVCPISRRPSSLAIRNPKRISSHSCSVGFRFVSTPGSGRRGWISTVWSITCMPLSSISFTMAFMMVSSFRSGRDASTRMVVRSGIMTPFLYSTSFVTLPIMVTFFTSCCFSVCKIFPTFPTLIV